MSAIRSAPIATLTMNPALDIATSTDEVTAVHKLRCSEPRRDPGSGGINVARVVHILGGKACAVYPAGGGTGRMLEAWIRESAIEQHVIPIAGLTRENFTVDERATGEQYRFVLPGPALSQPEQEHCLEAIAALDPCPAYLVASGSLPPGVPADFYARVAREASARGTKLILDTSGDALLQLRHQGVYLVKPNLRELSQFVGRRVDDEHDQIAASREMLRLGCAEVVVLSLGADGALLVTADSAQRFAAIDVPVRSAVGAGDSMVGGIVFGLARGDGLHEAVRLGMAAAAAALITEGTALCRREDVERLYRAAG